MVVGIAGDGKSAKYHKMSCELSCASSEHWLFAPDNAVVESSNTIAKAVLYIKSPFSTCW